MNKNTGEVGLGIRLTFLDKRFSKSIGKLSGFSIQLASSKTDAWAIFAGKDDAPGPWLVLADPEQMDKIQVVCDL